jgi:hypothetical protein
VGFEPFQGVTRDPRADFLISKLFRRGGPRKRDAPALPCGAGSFCYAEKST